MPVITTATLVGSEPREVTVEADFGGAKESFSVVGLPDAAVREARLRVQSAVAAAGLRLPKGGKLINLSPAGLRKEGPAYDVPIALSALVGAGQVPANPVVAIGELGLDGSVRAVNTAVAAGVVAARSGRKCLVPAPMAAGVSALTGAVVVPIRSLAEAVAVLEGGGPAAEPAVAGDEIPPGPDLAVVRGQPIARRALEVAAAGGHHLLLTGPPGSGKTLLASCLPGLLPPLSAPERLELALVHAAAGLGPPGPGRPFRTPHHSASEAALLGGGTGIPVPGELSKAHHGVLFLDELGEFPARHLDGLRQPLEAGRVHVARRSASVSFPAAVQLVAATNPCPCGHLGDRLVGCWCTPAQVDRYRRRLSGPLLDRIDLRVFMPTPDPDDLFGPPGEPTADVAGRVLRARAIQAERAVLNRDLGSEALDDLPTSDEGRRLLRDAVERGVLGGRGRDRVRRVARTLADLAGEEPVAAEHVAEALALRGAR